MMRCLRLRPGLLLGALLVLSLPALGAGSQAIRIGAQSYQVRIPAGYRLELLTPELEAPRLFSFAPNGDLLIGSRSGNVYRLPPPYTRPEVLVSLPDYPHSVALRDGELFIAQSSGLYRAPYRNGQTTLTRDALELVAALPGGGGHSSRTVRTGPDRRLYVSLGISGNCSDQYLDDSYPFVDRRGGVLVLDESGPRPRLRPYAAGLRNPVGFDWQPATGVLYASNNGPDHLGFDQPPEYFSRLLPGSFHGMPWFQYDGQRLRRDRCIERDPPRPVTEVSPPAATFPARNAPMGVTFVPEGALDPGMAGDAIVALRGSWGTQPSGGAMGDPSTRRAPKLVRVRFTKGEAQGVEDFVSGFQLPDGQRWARPVGVGFGPDGALYFTSDSGTEGLFRLSRSATGTTAAESPGSAPSSR